MPRNKQLDIEYLVHVQGSSVCRVAKQLTLNVFYYLNVCVGIISIPVQVLIDPGTASAAPRTCRWSARPSPHERIC